MGTRHRRVVWTEAASAALDEAIAYVAQDSPRNARELLERVLSAAQSLSSLSERGVSVPEVDDPRVRQLYPEPYRLIYQVEGDRVTILTVLHQRRDVDSVVETPGSLKWGRANEGLHLSPGFARRR